MDDNKDIEMIDGEEIAPEEENIKTYTEQDIQNSFNAGMKKRESILLKDEKYKEFLEWKESNQNDAERIEELTSLNDDLSVQNDELLGQIEELKAQIMVDRSDVKKEFSRFVTSEVMNSIDDFEDFGKALKEYKRNNPQFFGETVIKKIQTAPGLNGGTPPLTTNNIMNSIIRGARE